MGPWYPNWGPKTRVTWRGLGGFQGMGTELASGLPFAPGHASTRLCLVSEVSRIQERLINPVVLKVSWNPKRCMNETDRTLPLPHGRWSVHVDSIREVHEDQAALYVVQAAKEVLKS